MCPTATNTPSQGISRSWPVFFFTRTAGYGFPVQQLLDLAVPNELHSPPFAGVQIDLEARSSSRRWMRYTFWHSRERYSTSATAVLPPPHNGHGLVPVEHAVAGGAVRDPPAPQLPLAGQASSRGWAPLASTTVRAW